MSGTNSAHGNRAADARDMCTTEPAAEGGASASSAHLDSSLRQKSALTRRGFLKTTGALAGAAVVAGGAGTLTALADGNGAGQVTSEGEEIFRGVCRPNCFGFCHLNVHVRDGRIVKTSRAPYQDPRYSRICQRGLSHVSRIYDPNRLRYPLRRVAGTERGAGEWERISWDEAIAEIVAKFKEVQSEFGPEAVAVSTQSQVSVASTFTWTRFTQGFGCTTMGYSADNASKFAETRMTGGNTWESNERTDLINTKTIFVWGNNLTNAQHHMWHFVKEAQAVGKKLVVIDPVFTQIAAKADKWVPIRPGSDTALLLSMCNLIFENDDLNESYLAAHTDAPILVRSDTGRYLRKSDIDERAAEEKASAEEEAKSASATAGKSIASTYVDQPIVVQDGNLVPLDEAAEPPELFAERKIDGITCRTVLSMLRDHVAECTPAWASELTDIPEETIYDLYELVVDQPVSHMVGYGPQAYMNGVHTTLAGFTMCGLIGNLGYAGASYGSEWTKFSGFNMSYLTGAGVSKGATIGAVVMPTVIMNQEYKGRPYPVRMLISTLGNPVCCCPDANLWKKAMSKLDYVVVVDPYMTDTARYADIVLPAAQYFEQEDVNFGSEIPTLNFNEKAIDPLYESKTDVEIVHLLAEALGKGDSFLNNNSDVLKFMIDGPTCESLGISYDSLREKKEQRYFADEPHIAFRDGRFATPTGRLQFYADNPSPGDTSSEKVITTDRLAQERMATWFPPANAWPGTKSMERYPLICNSERPRFRVHSQWFSTPILRELDPEPIVKMNPADAVDRNLLDGQYVEVYNDLGHVVVRLEFSDAIRPGMVVYPKGWQMSQHKDGSWSELISTDYDEYGVNGNFMDVTCEVRAWDGE